MKREALRIIDANFNRSREGLRVCEDIVRFVLNSPPLTKELKAARHAISDILKSISGSEPLLSQFRDSVGDVGRVGKAESEMRRLDYSDIFSANIERVKESLRVLEEIFKLIDASSSVKFARLRFRIYDIEKRASKRISSLRNTRQRPFAKI